ncbi:MAG: glycoside hydrolase family 127 protein [Thermomicrobiales bacterium]
MSERHGVAVLGAPKGARFSFGGPIGERLAANVRNWLLVAPAANPAMLQMLRDRDRTPARELVPWAGEFAGKYLISGVQALRITPERRLRATLRAFVADLIACQDEDGYLGPFPRDRRMVGPKLWDLWGQYHCMLGLLLWYRETGDKRALAACRRCADYFCAYFLDGGRRVLEAGSEEMNESSAHIFALLYQETGEARYLELLRAIERDWEEPPSGDYVRAALAGRAFYQTPKPRWESLHSIQAIADVDLITGEERYRRAFEQMWWSIAEFDRHSTGGFTSGEQATGNPYDPGAIETCCTIAWMAMTIDQLRLTGDSRAADELEIATWNAVLGAQNADGRWWTYNTPMDGERRASAHDIVFQARAGSPELNCCSVNGPRGLGMLSEWAVMVAGDGLALNYYGPGTLAVPLASGNVVRLEQETAYPLAGRIVLRVTPDRAERFALRLRIPGWSRATAVALNGERQAGVWPGTYLMLEREWRAGDTLEIALDEAVWLWPGEREAAGKVALYQGPILLAYDPRFDAYDPTELPALDLACAPEALEVDSPAPRPLLLRRFATVGGGSIALCDFASAGAAGNRYVSWLPAPGLGAVPFGRDNPWRMAGPALSR